MPAMVDFEKINFLKRELQGRGVDGRTLRSKSVGEMEAMLSVLEAGQEQVVSSIDLDSLEPEDESVGMAEAIEEQFEKIPGALAQHGTLEWNSYVHSQFEEGELKDGFPTVDGLRRLTRKLIGNIVGTEIVVVQPPNPDNQFASTVVFTLSLAPHDDSPGPIRRYSDVSDASVRNTEHPFNLHLSSTAATRAEGRVLRKLLGVRTLAAEELAPPDAKIEEIPEFAPGSFMNDAQILLIDRLCRGLDINVEVYLNSGSTQYKELSHMPQAVASKVIEHLHVLKKEPKTVSAALKGYDPDWKNNILTD